MIFLGKKFKLTSVGRKVLHHTRHVSKKTAAISFLMVLIVGAILPLALGYAVSHAESFAMTTPINVNPEKVEAIWYCFDGYTYTGDVAWDGKYAVAVYDRSLLNKGGTHPYPDHAKIKYCYNSSIFESADKIIIDGEISKNVSVELWIDISGKRLEGYTNIDVKIENGTYHIEAPITPALLMGAKKSDKVYVIIVFRPKQGNLDGLYATSHVEFEDIKGFSPETTTNILLGASGIILLIGGICATPWINPTKWYHSWFNSRNSRRRRR